VRFIAHGSGRISCGEEIGDAYNQDGCAEREATGLRKYATRALPSRYVSDKEGVSRSREIFRVCCKVRDDREEKRRRSRGGSAWTILLS
jgi:hypothetical protein